MSERDSINLPSLRALALAATDGPWEWDGLALRSPSGYRVLRIDGYEAADDMAFIAALSPDVVLALLDRVEAAEARVAELETTRANAARAIGSLHAVMALDCRDQALNRNDAWLYGIVIGWDDALPEVAADHDWDKETQERIEVLHVALRKLAEGVP